MRIGEIFFILIIIGTPCILCDRWDDQETRRFVEEYIPKLQQNLNLRRADDDSDENYITSKTITKNSRRYDVHLVKLRSVNGLKRHNLIVKEKSDDNPLIYIINPVETKIPHAFVSQTEFKDILNNRVKKQRNEVYKKVDPLLPLMPVNSTYWTKLSWSDRHQNSFKRRQHNKNPAVTSKDKKKHSKLNNVPRTKYESPPIPYIHYMRNGNKKSNTNKTKNLRTNKTNKAKTNRTKYLRSNSTSKVKKLKTQYLRNNRTSKAMTLTKNETIKAQIIYLRSNRSIITKRNEKILQKLSTIGVQMVSHIFKKDQNISITEEISKAKIIGKLINETIDRQTTKEIIKEKSTTDNDLPATKNEVTDTTEASNTTKQSTEEVPSEKPTNLDITIEKLKTGEEINIESPKTDPKNTGQSKNEGETTDIPTDSEITTEKLTAEDKSEVSTTTKESIEEVTSEKPTNLDITTEKLKADEISSYESPKTVPENTKNEEETTEMPTDSEKTTKKLTTEDKTTKEPPNTETLNTEHSKEEQSMATQKTAETLATEDTTKSNDNTESVNTADQEVDLATDQSKVEETTQQKHLPFRTTMVKRSTTKARTKTTRTRLSRPLVFMGDMGNGNSWN